MLDTSSWIQPFAPKAARQAVWAELVEELSHPVNSTSTSQVAEDTVSLLMAMGMEAHAYPSSTALADWTASEAGTRLRLEARTLALDDNRWLELPEKDCRGRRRRPPKQYSAQPNSRRISMTHTWLRQGRRAARHALPEKWSNRNRQRILNLALEKLFKTSNG
ncbi:Eukaryotic/viral aspartic protease [Phytophthora megakarya]|uniref:Eukaryotic/viral aspartic protease n=1 Tax=Phytophthora megakarya TaxID=4795 RepID=A0A225UNV5_9STRA|nr:Eukaryotic/viral aspartic protease [Phytophthora megakarya]